MLGAMRAMRLNAMLCCAVLCELTVIEDDAKVEFRAPSLFRLVCFKISDVHCACRDELITEGGVGLD